MKANAKKKLMGAEIEMDKKKTKEKKITKKTRRRSIRNTLMISFVLPVFLMVIRTDRPMKRVRELFLWPKK